MDGILGRPRIATMIPGRGADQIRERNPSFYVTISSGSADRKLTHHHVISRVSGIVSTIRSLRSLVPWILGRHPTPSTILRTRIVATPSIFLRGIPAQYTNLYFSFGRTIAASRLADRSWITTMTIAELKSRECRKSGRKPSAGQKLPCRAIVADSWNERKSPRLCFHARNVRFLLGVSIRSDKLEHDLSQYWYRAGGGAVMSGVALFSSPSLSLSLSPSRDAQQGERERESERNIKRG